MSEKPFISIIVPVYNVEKHLCACIDSLVNQSYQNKEIILVDDGSKDNSPCMCDNYAAAYPFIKVIHQENAGVAKARNRGLDVAIGEYIVFVDSDDMLKSNYLDLVYDSMVKYGSAYVSCAFVGFVGNMETTVFDYLKDEGDCINTDRYLSIMATYQAGAYWGANWGKLFQKRIIDAHNIRFESNILFAEDFRFNLEYLMHVEKISIIHEPIYIYRIDTSDSLSKKKRNSYQFWDEYYELYLRYVKLYKHHGIYNQHKKRLDTFKNNAAALVIRNDLRQNKRNLLEAKKVFSYIKKSPADVDIHGVKLWKLFLLEVRFRFMNRGK